MEDKYVRDYAAVVRYGAGDTHLLLKAMHENPEHQQPGSNLRLVTADSLDEEDRHSEAEALRSPHAIHLEPPHPSNRNYRIKRVVNDTHYDADTPIDAIRALEAARRDGTRVHVSFGDDNGRDWLEDNEGFTRGRIGRSMGPRQIPILVNNSRSMGGSPLLGSIVRIRETPGGRVLWQHPNYHHGEITVQPKSKPEILSDHRVLTHDVLRDGQLHAAFESLEKAMRWVKKMGLTPTSVGG